MDNLHIISANSLRQLSYVAAINKAADEIGIERDELVNFLHSLYQHLFQYLAEYAQKGVYSTTITAAKFGKIANNTNPTVAEKVCHYRHNKAIANAMIALSPGGLKISPSEDKKTLMEISWQ